MTTQHAGAASLLSESNSDRIEFSALPLERQLAASAAFADHLMATRSVDANISRDTLIAACHELLLVMPREAFD